MNCCDMKYKDWENLLGILDSYYAIVSCTTRTPKLPEGFATWDGMAKTMMHKLPDPNNKF